MDFYRSGRLDLAEQAFRAILATRPNDFDTLYPLGIMLAAQGRYEEALRVLGTALQTRPRHGAALSLLGLAQARLGQLEAALASQDRAIGVDPGFTEAHNNRANVLAALGRPQEALASYDRALMLAPDRAEIHNNRGNVLRTLKHFEDALASYDRAIALKPDYAHAFDNRGIALRDLKRPAEALTSHDRAIALKPDHGAAFNNRSNALAELDRPEEALASADRALALAPGLAAAAHQSRANALKALRRPEEALAAYDQVLAHTPEDADTHAAKAELLTELGRFEEAFTAVDRAIALAPRHIHGYYSLVACRHLTFDDPHLRAMLDLAQDISALTLDEQIALHFALGQALADAGDHAAAFDHLVEGNALQRRRITYDEAATLGLMDRMRAAFDRELMSRLAGRGEPSTVPVFILGMPRSGSSLVEQILASHPGLFGAGETDDLEKVLRAQGGAAAACLEAPEAAAGLSAETLRHIGSSYVDRLQALAPAALRITDKTLANIRFIGLIHLALPQARIIHITRDPVDTCLSCFSKLFAGYLPYTYDLAELGRYHRAYARLMAHWRAILPEHVMLDLRYEDIVGDLEGEARKILFHCGLDWDARCLDFHQTRRSVRTASVMQVRQPLYRHAVGRWRRHEARLGPLLDALGASL